MEAEDIDEPDGVGGGLQGPTGEEDDDRHGEGRGVSEEEEVVTLDSQRIFLLMRKEYRSGDYSDSDEVLLTLGFRSLSSKLADIGECFLMNSNLCCQVISQHSGPLVLLPPKL